MLGAAALRHEVMKAILMNSAEKVEGRIGMGRTVLDRSSNTWDQSDARDVPSTTPATDMQRRKLPFDDEMGAGFLNARRAQTQLRGGRFDPQDPMTGPIGWDYRSIEGQDTIKKYTLPRLKGGSWISTTLTWDRKVELNDTNSNDRYDVGETFGNPQLSDLDLYLMPAGATGLHQNLWSSISTDYNVEHIFFKLPTGSAAYELWVRQANTTNVDYAIAWWAESAPPEQPRKMGDKVWEDLDGNGIQDDGEEGVHDVAVELYTSTGTLVGSTTTDYDGNYQFEALTGSYYVKFIAPYGKGFTTRDAGSDDALDSDADPDGRSHVFTIASSDDFTIDAGLVALPYGSIGDSVWNDANGNGIQDSGELGMPDVEVTLYTSSGDYVSATFTNSAGNYLFTSIAPGSYHIVVQAPANYGFSPKDAGSDDTVDSDANPSGQTDPFSLALGQNKTDVDAGLVLIGASVGDFVWHDSNHNGIQDPLLEDGLTGVTVNLYTHLGSLIATTTTSGDGYYAFISVAPEDYYIVVEPPDDYAFTTRDAGSDDTIDSDTDLSGQTAVFTLFLGQTKMDVDAGLVSLYYASVGDYVWGDTDGDGIQDVDETGIAGVEVRLYTSTGSLLATGLLQS